MPNAFYGTGLPGLSSDDFIGKLIVIEGSDGSGRTSQIQHLTPWLEQLGHSVVNSGIRRSTLVSKELDAAKNGNTLSRNTMSLFYATDFADQLENNIIPALRSGSVVLCDRYIYTLMARDQVRGASRDWLEHLYGFALIPDLIFYLNVDATHLVERNFENNFRLDYWESGMDLRLGEDRFDSFIRYQEALATAFLSMKDNYGFHIVDGNEDIERTQQQLRDIIAPIFSD